MARTPRTGTRRTRPEPPDVPGVLDPAPGPPESGTTWDGIRIDRTVELPAHVADLTLQECRFDGVDLSGRGFGGLRCRDTEFVRCDLSGAVLEDASLTRVRFTGCRLTGVVLSGARLVDVHLLDCRADLANLRMAQARYLLAEDTGLQGADLYRFVGTDCGFLGCDLTGAGFDDAELTDAHLHGSTVEGVRGALALRGSRISPDQQLGLGSALLAALGITVTDSPEG